MLKRFGYLSRVTGAGQNTEVAAPVRALLEREHYG